MMSALACCCCTAGVIGQWAGPGFGEPAKVEVDGFALEAQAAPDRATFHAGKQRDWNARVSVRLSTPAAGTGATAYGLSNRWKCTGNPSSPASPRREQARETGFDPRDSELADPDRDVDPFEAFRAGDRDGRNNPPPKPHERPRNFVVPLKPAGPKPPLFADNVEGEILAADLKEEVFVFAGADLKEGASAVQRGLKVRLALSFAHQGHHAVGVTVSGPAEKVAAMFAGLPLACRPGPHGTEPRWRLETDAGKEPDPVVQAPAFEKEGEVLHCRFRADFPLAAGQRPKSVTLTVPHLASVWRSHQRFKFDKLPLPPPREIKPPTPEQLIELKKRFPGMPLPAPR